MNPVIKITLVQFKDVHSVYQYRIAKLVGAVVVEAFSGTGRKKSCHVGDVMSEQEANDLALCKRYEVTVFEKSGAR